MCIDEHTKVSDHLSVLNVIVSKLETIGVNIDDEDKTLRLIWPLSSSYEPIKPLLIYGKKTLSFEEVDSKIISEERKLKGENNSSSNSVLIVKGKSYVKKTNETGVRCWKSGKIRHVKYKCPDGVTLEKSIESNASNVSLDLGGNDLL